MPRSPSPFSSEEITLIGAILRQIRIQTGKSTVWCGQQVRGSRHYWYQLERGDLRLVDLDLLKRVLDVFPTYMSEGDHETLRQICF